MTKRICSHLIQNYNTRKSQYESLYSMRIKKFLSAKCPVWSGICLSCGRRRRLYCCVAIDGGGSNPRRTWLELWMLLVISRSTLDCQVAVVRVKAPVPEGADCTWSPRRPAGEEESRRRKRALQVRTLPVNLISPVSCLPISSPTSKLKLSDTAHRDCEILLVLS